MRHFETDVAVVAAGPAGLAAAVAAAEGGARVTVFEKAAVTGGEANMGMGPFAVESDVQRRQQDDLTVEEAFRRFMDYNQWNVDAQIVHDYFAKSGDTIRWLEDMGVRFVAAMKNFPASEATWHVVLPDDGKVGTRCASTMVKAMTNRAAELGCDIELKAQVTELKVEDGSVLGARGFFTADGEEFDVDARAVIVATGGFGSNPEMVAKNCGYALGSDMFTFMIPGLVGDGVRMVWNAGGRHGRMMMEKIVGHGIPDVLSGGLLQALNFSQGSPICINKTGRRVCDESVMQNMAVGANIIDIQPDRTVYRILDDKAISYLRKHGQDFATEVLPGDPTEDFDSAWELASQKYPEWAWRADSVEGLAEEMGIDSEMLRATIDRYNDLCYSGYDEDFGKPHRYLRALDGDRYYAYRQTISAYGSLGGIKVNPEYEVIADDGYPIEGLYAAGNDCCEIYNGTYDYYFPGNTMGFAINSGRMAGENAAMRMFEE